MFQDASEDDMAWQLSCWPDRMMLLGQPMRLKHLHEAQESKQVRRASLPARYIHIKLFPKQMLLLRRPMTPALPH
jgi:hypothetical protein